LTREALKIFYHHDFKISILTKSNLVLRDLDILKKARVVVGITITTLDEDKAKKLEPRASSPQKRIETIKTLSKNGIPTVARIDPIIPYVNDSEIEELVKCYAEAWASNIVSSTYKVKIDNWVRMKKSFPEEMSKLRNFYFSKGEKISGYYYLPKAYRLKIMKRVANEARKFGIDFSVCREGFFELNTGSCDGFHLLYK
jgi:DNA repair photolyase